MRATTIFSKKDLFFIFLIFAIVLLWWIVVFSGFQPVDRCDWDKYFTYHELQRKTILEYQQFPLWNPYVCGGEPWLAHPNSNFLSPFFLPILILGSISGTVCAYFLQVFAGLTGMYFLSRYYRLSRILSLLNSVFFLNIFNIVTFVGSFPLLSICLFPWIYRLFKKSIERKGNLFLLAIILSWTIYAGSTYLFVMSFMVLSIETIYFSFAKKKPGYILSLLGAFFLAILFAIPKLLPMIELLSQYPRHIELASFSGFFNIDNIKSGLLVLKYFFFSGDNMYLFLTSEKAGIFGYNFSLIAILILILSHFLLWKKNKILVIISVIFLFLALGDNSPFNIFRILRYFLPQFKEPHKFFILLLSIYALSVGLTLKELEARTVHKKISKFVIFVILFLISFNAFNCAGKIFKERPIIEYKFGNQTKEFFQTDGDAKKMFATIYNNKAVVYAYDSFSNQIQTKVIPKGRKDYRGEYFLEGNSGEARQLFFSPNKLKFNLNVYQDDILIINQNYFSGWRSSIGKVINHDGLIGIPVSKKDHDVTVYYLPGSFIIGAVILICFLVVTIYVRLKKRKMQNLS